MTNNYEHSHSLSDTDLDTVVGGLNPQPLPPGPPPELQSIQGHFDLSRFELSNFRF